MPKASKRSAYRPLSLSDVCYQSFRKNREPPLCTCDVKSVSSFVHEALKKGNGKIFDANSNRSNQKSSPCKKSASDLFPNRRRVDSTVTIKDYFKMKLCKLTKDSFEQGKSLSKNDTPTKSDSTKAEDGKTTNSSSKIIIEIHVNNQDLRNLKDINSKNNLAKASSYVSLGKKSSGRSGACKSESSFIRQKALSKDNDGQTQFEHCVKLLQAMLKIGEQKDISYKTQNEGFCKDLRERESKDPYNFVKEKKSSKDVCNSKEDPGKRKVEYTRKKDDIWKFLMNKHGKKDSCKKIEDSCKDFKKNDSFKKVADFGHEMNKDKNISNKDGTDPCKKFKESLMKSKEREAADSGNKKEDPCKESKKKAADFKQAFDKNKMAGKEDSSKKFKESLQKFREREAADSRNKKDQCKKQKDPRGKQDGHINSKTDICKYLMAKKEKEDPCKESKKNNSFKKEADFKQGVDKDNISGNENGADPCKKFKDSLRKSKERDTTDSRNTKDQCKKKEDSCEKRDDYTKEKTDICTYLMAKKANEDICKKNEDPCKDSKNNLSFKKVDGFKQGVNKDKRAGNEDGADLCKKFKESLRKSKEREAANSCSILSFKKVDGFKQGVDKDKGAGNKDGADLCKKFKESLKKSKEREAANSCNKTEDPCKKNDDPCKDSKNNLSFKKVDGFKQGINIDKRAGNEDGANLCKKFKESLRKSKEREAANSCSKTEVPCKKNEDPCKDSKKNFSSKKVDGFKQGLDKDKRANNEDGADLCKKFKESLRKSKEREAANSSSKTEDPCKKNEDPCKDSTKKNVSFKKVDGFKQGVDKDKGAGNKDGADLCKKFKESLKKSKEREAANSCNKTEDPCKKNDDPCKDSKNNLYFKKVDGFKQGVNIDKRAGNEDGADPCKKFKESLKKSREREAANSGNKPEDPCKKNKGPGKDSKHNLFSKKEAGYNQGVDKEKGAGIQAGVNPCAKFKESLKKSKEREAANSRNKTEDPCKDSKKNISSKKVDSVKQGEDKDKGAGIPVGANPCQKFKESLKKSKEREAANSWNKTEDPCKKNEDPCKDSKNNLSSKKVGAFKQGVDKEKGAGNEDGVNSCDKFKESLKKSKEREAANSCNKTEDPCKKNEDPCKDSKTNLSSKKVDGFKQGVDKEKGAGNEDGANPCDKFKESLKKSKEREAANSCNKAEDPRKENEAFGKESKKTEAEDPYNCVKRDVESNESRNKKGTSSGGSKKQDAIFKKSKSNDDVCGKILRNKCNDNNLNKENNKENDRSSDVHGRDEKERKNQEKLMSKSCGKIIWNKQELTGLKKINSNSANKENQKDDCIKPTPETNKNPCDTLKTLCTNKTSNLNESCQKDKHDLKEVQPIVAKEPDCPPPPMQVLQPPLQTCDDQCEKKCDVADNDQSLQKGLNDLTSMLPEDVKGVDSATDMGLLMQCMRMARDKKEAVTETITDEEAEEAMRGKETVICQVKKYGLGEKLVCGMENGIAKEDKNLWDDESVLRILKCVLVKDKHNKERFICTEVLPESQPEKTEFKQSDIKDFCDRLCPKKNQKIKVISNKLVCRRVALQARKKGEANKKDEMVCRMMTVEEIKSGKDSKSCHKNSKKKNKDRETQKKALSFKDLMKKCRDKDKDKKKEEEEPCKDKEDSEGKEDGKCGTKVVEKQCDD